MGCSYEIKEDLPAVIRDKQTGRRLIETWLFLFCRRKGTQYFRYYRSFSYLFVWKIQYN